MNHNHTGLDCVSAGAVRKRETLGKSSPRDMRRDHTTWVRDLKTGDAIEVYFGSSRAEHDLQVYLGWWADIAFHTITDGPCECVEYITADGEPVAWIDEGGWFTTDEINGALFPVREAAE
ncbi:MAG: hypothetical protein AB7R40_23835 [Nitrospiraceae bacterium]